jgi:hypothetical protein
MRSYLNASKALEGDQAQETGAWEGPALAQLNEWKPTLAGDLFLLLGRTHSSGGSQSGRKMYGL